MSADLRGHVAVVTGALGRLGPVWVEALAGAGATVIGVDLRDGDSGALAAVEIADVTDPAAVAAARDRIVEAYGVPHVLINNAGIDQPPGPARTHAIEDWPLDDFLGTVEVNLAGTFVVTQAFGSVMRDAGRGSIVNLGSLYATVAPIPDLYDHLGLEPPFLKPPAYAASKAGVLALTRYFARLWGPNGVRVNALSPGGVAGGQDSEFTRKFTDRVALGRMAEPADLVGPLLFLASDASRYVTGQELRVDGGWL